MNQQKLLTPEDVAGMLGTSRLFVMRQARIGEIPAIKVGKVWRFRLSTIEAWLTSKERSTSETATGHDSAIH
jgi:excisionase family DNA binding protein